MSAMRVAPLRLRPYRIHCHDQRGPQANQAGIEDVFAAFTVPRLSSDPPVVFCGSCGHDGHVHLLAATVGGGGGGGGGGATRA